MSKSDQYEDYTMRATFKHFASASESWESMFADAAAFATEVGPGRLIGISHSHGGGNDLWGHGGSGVVTVWYWEQVPQPSRQA
jgi:hypothetical protein